MLRAKGAELESQPLASMHHESIPLSETIRGVLANLKCAGELQLHMA